MARIFLAFVFVLSLCTGNVNAQLREVPPAVKEIFDKQYPAAQEVTYKDLLTSVQVHFVLQDEKYIAKYSSKGVWKETEKEWNFGHLSDAVKDGFRKSKFADWEVEETKIVYRAADTELYRIKVKKNDIQKKYLLFNGEGRLLQDDITL